MSNTQTKLTNREVMHNHFAESKIMESLAKLLGAKVKADDTLSRDYFYLQSNENRNDISLLVRLNVIFNGNAGIHIPDVKLIILNVSKNERYVADSPRNASIQLMKNGQINVEVMDDLSYFLKNLSEDNSNEIFNKIFKKLTRTGAAIEFFKKFLEFYSLPYRYAVLNENEALMEIFSHKDFNKPRVTLAIKDEYITVKYGTMIKEKLLNTSFFNLLTNGIHSQKIIELIYPIVSYATDTVVFEEADGNVQLEEVFDYMRVAKNEIINLDKVLLNCELLNDRTDNQYVAVFNEPLLIRNSQDDLLQIGVFVRGMTSGEEKCHYKVEVQNLFEKDIFYYDSLKEAIYFAGSVDIIV